MVSHGGQCLDSTGRPWGGGWGDRGSSEAESEDVVLALSPLSPIGKCWTRDALLRLDPLSAPQRSMEACPSISFTCSLENTVILHGPFPAPPLVVLLLGALHIPSCRLALFPYSSNSEPCRDLLIRSSHAKPWGSRSHPHLHTCTPAHAFMCTTYQYHTYWNSYRHKHTPAYSHINAFIYICTQTYVHPFTCLHSMHTHSIQPANSQILALS